MSELERLNIALKETFRRIGISKKGDMATHLDYKRNYFSDITRGASPISDHFLNRISDKMGINSIWIRTGVGSMLKTKSESDYSENRNMPPGGTLEDNIWTMIQTNDRNSRSLEKMVETADRNSLILAKLVDLLHERGVQVSASFHEEKGGLKCSGKSDKDSALDADRASAGL